MGKRRCFLGFLVSLCVFIFSANSFAADGYTCKKEYTSCTAGHYLNSSSQCVKCPAAYPNSDGGSGDITSCYSNTKSRPWSGSQENGTTPTNCYSVTEWTGCSIEACEYVAYSNASGTGDGTVKTGCETNNASCIKTPAAVTAKSGYYVSGTSCLSCSDKNNDYPNSDNGNTGGWTACYSDTKSRPWSGSQENGATPTNCYSVTSWDSCSGAACDYVAYLNTSGTGDGTIKSGCETNNASCTKTPAAVTAKSGYYVSGTSCSSCSAKNNDYPNSDNGNTGGWTACYSNDKTRAWNGSTVACANPDTVGCDDYTCTNSNCDTSSCTYTAYLNTAGNGEGEIKTGCATNSATCHETVASLTPKTGHHTDGTDSCPANIFNVNYANGGGTGSGPTSPTSCTYGGTCSAPSNTYTRNGYDFTGWSCTASRGQCAKSSYAADESISTATSFNDATITLTATWSENAGNCIDGQYFNGTACVSCKTLDPEYTSSDGNRDSTSSCYKSCTKTCSGTAACPANATCTYNMNHSTTGTQHYNGTCSADDPGSCPLTSFTCDACSLGTGAETCNVTKGTDSCTYTGTCSNGYAAPTASGSTVSCTTCADTYYYNNGTCTSCGTVSCPDRSGTESCTCSCSVANGTCTCANGQQNYTDSCLYTNGAGGTFGASACTGESYTRKTTGDCTGTNTITCNQNYYLNNGSCQSCPSAFPNTDASGKTKVTACYTQCVASDVTGATSVNGQKYSNDDGTGVGNKTCSASACDSNHCLANGENGLKICVVKPEHGQCTNNPNKPIQCNTGYHLDNGDCVADTYTVTYSCGTGSGTEPADQTATYDASFTPSNNTCSQTDYVFAGSTVSGTNDIKEAGVAFTWKYTENKTFTAKFRQTANNCLGGEYDEYGTVTRRGQYFDETTSTCLECPAEFPMSQDGATDISQCYKQCNRECTKLGAPLGATSSGFIYELDISKGKQYYDSNTCDAPEIYCGYNYITCKTNYYLNLDIWDYSNGRVTSGQEGHDNACIKCSTLGGINGSTDPDLQYAYCEPNNFDVYGGGPHICHTDNVQMECSQILPPPQNAADTGCTYKDYNGRTITSTPYAAYYDSSELTPISINGYTTQPRGCYVQKCDCAPGYKYTKPVWADDSYRNWDSTDAGSCDPDLFTITLNDNGGTGGNGTIYEKYSVGWYSDSAVTTSITSVTKPTLDANHSFLGYFASPDADDTPPIIPPSGALSNSTVLTANATLYAHWSEDTFNCVAGKTAANATCPDGSYCPGGSVSASLKNDPVQGCARTCPSDVSGGTVTSPDGSADIESCQTTRTGVPLNDGTGGGDQVCNYKKADGAYTNCDKIQIKYCNAGYYRVSQDAQSCNKVGAGYWSPAPTNTTVDNISMVRYPCSALPGYSNATTGGENPETSGLPTACYNTCPNKNVLDESNSIIGSSAANPGTVYFAGTIAAYDYENATVTTDGSYPACTYEAPVCNDGYHTAGMTCEPNIYTFTLNKNGGDGGDGGPIYMKYNTGWFTDSGATVQITSITLPTQGTQNCTGYDVTIEGTQRSVINESGEITASSKLVAYDDYETPIELMASWIQKKTETCAAGEYYEHDTHSCQECLAGHYCEGGTAYDDDDADEDDHFITKCPAAVADTTYTPAQEWNGTELVNIAPNVTSAPGSSDVSACYATVKHSATNGAGSRVCHFASGKYESDCTEEQILTCNIGFYLDTTNLKDCTIVGYQYYSAAYLLTRNRCPGAEYDVDDPRNTISTDGTESEFVTSCVREGVWEVTEYGGRTTRCHWNPSKNEYSTNCGSYTIRKCAAGYWDELEGETTSDETADCVPVGFGYWSPAPENMDSTMTTDTVSTKRTRCLPGTGARDVVSTEPTTATETSADITACYLNCVPTKDLNGTEVSVTNSPVHYNTTKNAYDTCIYDSDTCPKDMWCDENGFYDCPADKDGNPGKADLVSRQRNRGIDTCYVLYNPFKATPNYPNHIWTNGTGWVKAYYEGTQESGDYTNYFIAGALTCDAGYYYTGSTVTCSGVESCYYSPAQSEFADETPTKQNPGSSTKPVACPAGCSGSAPYASSYTQCYKACDLGVSDFDHSKTKTVVPESPTVTGASATTYNECLYTLTCVDGYEPQNNGTATPSCQAKEYTITLNKNGGAGATPASVQCTFDSGACELPAIEDTRDGYSTANKWCTAADGTGTCYDAGTTVTTNISAKGDNIELFAQWTPNVYTITLDHNGAATAGAPSTVYLKYATGWYSDNTASTPIEQMTTLPEKTGYVFAGYGKNPEIITTAGAFVTAQNALSFTTTDTTVLANWSAGNTQCPEGTYYQGRGATCLPCNEDHYCPGGEYPTDGGENGQFVCPDDGKAPTESKKASDCYKENLPTYQADHGRGTQTCYYSETALSYSDRCKDFAIVTCDAGYWLDTTLIPLPKDCAPAGHGYYSADLELEHHACPNGGTTTENNETAESVYECYKTDLDYTPTDLSGSGKQSCWYSSGDGDSAIYERECFDQVINKCRGGYYLANSTDIVCSEVGQNHYSGEDDIARHPCLDGGKTNGTMTADIGLCYKDGLEYRARHGGGSQTCNWDDNVQSYSMTCGNKQITYCDGGYWLDLTQRSDDCVEVGYNWWSPDPEHQTPSTPSTKRELCPAGKITLGTTSDSADDCFTCLADHVCNTEIGDETCSDLTGGRFTKSDAGTDDVAYCYRQCTADNASSVSGKDYYGDNVPDECEIHQCNAGYMLNEEKTACVQCKAGSYCDGTPGDDGDGAKSCAILGDGSWKYSAPGATEAGDCYRLCTEHRDGDCLLVPVDDRDKAYWPNKCQYTATINGNPAEYNPDTEMCTLTGCTTGFEMVNGICEPCNRENAVLYKAGPGCIVESCAVGYHPQDDQCEPDILDCTPQAPNATYAEQKWVATRSAFGICEIKSCEDGYHLASNACVANEQVCSVAHGVGIKTWNMDTKSWNPCEATSCVPGYTNEPYEKNDADEQCSECRNMYSTLGEVAATGYKTGCEIASCIYQGEKYNLENNECVPICNPERSDETGEISWNDFTKKCERTCSTGYMSW